MEPNYTMIGADGQQYGPVPLEQIKAWVAEGRIAADTKILRSDSPAWRSAAEFLELGFAPAGAIPAAAPPPFGAPSAASPRPVPFQAAPPADLAALRQVRVGSSWFFWVAGLSAVNAIMAASGAGLVFLFGLGITQLTGNLVFSLILCGILGGLGWFARQMHVWAFILGMVLYGLDGLIFVERQLWFPLAFHGYVLFRLGMGLVACFKLKSNPSA